MVKSIFSVVAFKVKGRIAWETQIGLEFIFYFVFNLFILLLFEYRFSLMEF